MKKVSLVVALFGLAPAVVWAQPAISSVLNAASYDAAISPGCWVAVMGSGLANTTLASDPNAPALLTSLGGVSVVLFAGRVGALTGLYRIEVSAPVPATDRLYLRSGGWQSNITELGILGGRNVSNVTGFVDSVYPSGDAAFGLGATFALMLHAGTFSTSFDIAPAAGPFDIAAVGEGGGTIISIDPTASCVNDLGATSRGKYAASISTVTSAGARGDFSGSIVPLWDYLTCDPATWVCLASPLSTIPEPRLGKSWTAATQALPLPNVITSPGANAFGQLSGCLADLVTAPGGSHVVINAQNNKIFSVFGGFQQFA